MYFTRTFTYWKNRFPFVKPKFLFGSFMSNILSGKQSVTETLDEIHVKLKGDNILN